MYDSTSEEDKFQLLHDSGYVSSPNTTTKENFGRKFSFDDQSKNSMESLLNQSSTSKLNSNCTEDNFAASTELHLQGGSIYQRRQRRFSDPLPCSTKILINSIAQTSRSFVVGHECLNQSVQTCYYCRSQNNFGHCALCFRDVAQGSSSALMRRPVAIITPFKSVNLLNNDANLLSPDTVIDNVASRLREISDDFDQRYGARNAANVDFIIAGFGGIIWGFMRELVVAVARLVGL